jgi:CHAT domain-containing protein
VAISQTYLVRIFSAALLCLGSGLALVEDAAALSKEAAIESCRARIGKPRVVACVQRMVQMRGPPGMRYVDACRAPVIPLVQACVRQALTKANSRPDVPIALPTNLDRETVSTDAALKTGFVAPPRTISDIAAILDSERPDPAKVAARKVLSDSEPGKQLSKKELAEFYLSRGYARADLGLVALAIEDSQRATKLGAEAHEPLFQLRARQLTALQQIGSGDAKNGLASLEALIKAADAPGSKGALFNAYRQMTLAQVQAGDLPKAEAYVRRAEALLKEARTSPFPGWRTSYAKRGRSWEADVAATRGTLFEGRGQAREGEAEYAKAESFSRAAMETVQGSKFAPSAGQITYGAEVLVLAQARMKTAQGRLAEGEADSRRALLSQLKNQGKYSVGTARLVNGLAGQMIAQGRFNEAEKLIRTSLEIQDTIGLSADSTIRVQTLEQFGSALNYQGKYQESAKVYRDIDSAIASWEPLRRERTAMSSSRVTSLYQSGQVGEGIKLAQQQLERSIARFGAESTYAAIARGSLAIGYMRNKEVDEAAREFKISIPLLMNAARESSIDDSGSDVNAITGRLRLIVEAYISMLSHSPEKFDGDVATETFALADAVRGQTVQGALGASSARSSAKDPKLAELVRKEQDLGKRIAAQQAALNNALASGSRDENVIKATNVALTNARKELDMARREINRRFPSYAELVNPKPPSITQIKANLKDGEALVSFYFGRQSSFVWAVPKDGAPAFAAIDAKPGDLESKIRKVREALEPNATMIAEIPAFDLRLASELYTLLLKPVESGWKQSKSLIAVTNGALGLLPLSLLPTESVEIDLTGGTLFEGYRKVPWLARTHAVAMIPSSSALLTLRQTPKGREGRASLMAFGDPIFSTQQAEQASVADSVRLAEAVSNMRGGPLKRRNAPQLDGVDSAELAQLPRLPDTAEELTSIAQALKADPAKSVHLGKAANEAAVKQMDLSDYKVLAFATHGLVPGELNGLTQPALALSAPAVANAEGDGLLTLEEILGLRLDADWVVLSACNTGAGSGAGAEAASGLGRAFFYAGARALLVTNWSVHSQSARELVTDLFQRQADEETLSRSEALRRAMMAMVDGGSFKGDSGEIEFVYAHPLFWAPYTIIGDTGGL